MPLTTPIMIRVAIRITISAANTASTIKRTRPFFFLFLGGAEVMT